MKQYNAKWNYSSEFEFTGSLYYFNKIMLGTRNGYMYEGVWDGKGMKARAIVTPTDESLSSFKLSLQITAEGVREFEVYNDYSSDLGYVVEEIADIMINVEITTEKYNKNGQKPYMSNAEMWELMQMSNEDII